MSNLFIAAETVCRELRIDRSTLSSYMIELGLNRNPMVGKNTKRMFLTAAQFEQVRTLKTERALRKAVRPKRNAMLPVRKVS